MGVWWHALAFVTHERAKMSHKPGRNVTQAGPKCHTRAKMSHSHVIIGHNEYSHPVFCGNNFYFLTSWCLSSLQRICRHQLCEVIYSNDRNPFIDVPCLNKGSLIEICWHDISVSPHQMGFSLVVTLFRGYLWYTRINGWVNNRKAGDLRCFCAHCDVIVMPYITMEHHDEW